MAFINDDFLLTTDEAKELFHGYAEKMPIIDYHCHLPPAEIAQECVVYLADLYAPNWWPWRSGYHPGTWNGGG